MKFEVEVGQLRNAVGHAKVTTESSLPIFQGLYLEATKTDTAIGGRLDVFAMKNGAKSLFTMPANVTIPGSKVVRPDQLLAGLHGQEDDVSVTFTYSDKLERLCAICGGSRFKLAILDGASNLSHALQNLPTDTPQGSTFDANLFRQVVKRAAWVAQMENNGVKVELLDFKKTDTGYKVIATDGYVAVRVDVQTDLGALDQVILKESIESVGKFLSVLPGEQLRVHPGPKVDGFVRETFFRGPGFLYGSAVSASLAPAAEGVFTMPEFVPNRLILVTRSILENRLSRISGFVERTSPSVRLTLRGAVLTLETASESGDCVEPIEIVYSDASPLKQDNSLVTVSVANRFLAKALKSLDSEVIMLGLRGATSPLIVSDEKNAEINTRYAIMGCRDSYEVLEETEESTVGVPRSIVLEAEIVLEAVGVVEAQVPDTSHFPMVTPEETSVDPFFNEPDFDDDAEDADADDPFYVGPGIEVNRGSESSEIPVGSDTGA